MGSCAGFGLAARVSEQREIKNRVFENTEKSHLIPQQKKYKKWFDLQGLTCKKNSKKLFEKAKFISNGRAIFLYSQRNFI